MNAEDNSLESLDQNQYAKTPRSKRLVIIFVLVLLLAVCTAIAIAFINNSQLNNPDNTKESSDTSSNGKLDDGAKNTPQIENETTQQEQEQLPQQTPAAQPGTQAQTNQNIQNTQSSQADTNQSTDNQKAEEEKQNEEALKRLQEQIAENEREKQRIAEEMAAEAERQRERECLNIQTNMAQELRNAQAAYVNEVNNANCSSFGGCPARERAKTNYDNNVNSIRASYLTKWTAAGCSGNLY